MELLKQMLNEGYASEKTHEAAFQEVLDVLNSLGFDIGAKGYNLKYVKKPGNGFNAKYVGDFFEQHKMEKQLVDTLMKKGFKFGIPSSEKSALEWFLIKNPVFVRFSTSNKQLFVDCERLA